MSLPLGALDNIRRVLKDESLTALPIQGDGSSRKYHRLRSGNETKSFVVMELQDAKEINELKQNEYSWLKVRLEFEKLGIPVPNVLVSLNDWGCIVMEDGGPLSLQEYVLKIGDHGIEEAYRKACHYIEVTQNYKLPLASQNSNSIYKVTPELNYSTFSRELFFFYEQMFYVYLKKPLSDETKKIFDAEVISLCQFLEKLPKALCHRDYHSRNILFEEETDKWLVIDFQDAQSGPRLYDLASLLFDPYVNLAWEIRLKLLKEEMSKLKEKAIPFEFEAIFLQRSLKIMGTYVHLTLEKKRGNYLDYLRITLDFLNKFFEQKISQWPFLSGELISALSKEILKNG